MENKRDVGGRIKKFFVLIAAIFAVTIITALLGRLSSDTLALIIGVFVGGAIVGTPTVLAVSVAASYYQNQRQMQSPPRQQYLPQQQYPYPQQYLPPQAAYHVPPPQARQERDWDVIGSE